MKRILAAVMLCMFSLIVTNPVRADYPTGPVQFIVPWPPGDFEDILTRMIAKNMQEATGVSASVVNRPGGGDGPFPGALEVLEAPSDGSVFGPSYGCAGRRTEAPRHCRGQLRPVGIFPPIRSSLPPAVMRPTATWPSFPREKGTRVKFWRRADAAQANFAAAAGGLLLFR
ncbi:MAG: hypothetical protein CM15mP115_19550 [Alphaproteobacteria bacterium]|nr:MAG: hypothetical protein CM15mP115_19550 [Alphaproteobacteria bacterium]